MRVNRFWGEVDGKGENTLGKLLMELRRRTSKGKEDSATDTPWQRAAGRNEIRIRTRNSLAIVPA